MDVNLAVRTPWWAAGMHAAFLAGKVVNSGRCGAVGAELSSEPKRRAEAKAVCASRYAGQR